jgi:DegV family protein with EDD domain
MIPTKIITDGGSDLPKELIEKLDIAIVPLSVHFGHEVLNSNLDISEFYTRMKSVRELPKTSSPSPQDFLDCYRQAGENRDILVIALSSGLSSTYHHALMAKEMLLAEGYQGCIEVLDSRTASLGQGLLTYKAALLAQTKATFTELVQSMKSSILESGTFFSLNTLENVIKGGRLDRLRGTVASVLNIKLLMKASEEGTVEVIEKVRGGQQVLRRLIDKVGESAHDYEHRVLAVAHSNCEERARAFLELLLKKHPFRHIIFSSMGPVIGTYAGEGAVLVAYS